VGTSRLARRLTTILPAMPHADALETTRLHRVAGRTGARPALVTRRPCRAPHRPISDVARNPSISLFQAAAWTLAVLVSTPSRSNNMAS
jgi:Magnesium chelatase, subunit ChlI